MALQKRTPPRKSANPEPPPQVKPMPFPGESPTVSLAMAAARMYGLPPEEEKPTLSAPKRRSPGKKKAATAAPKRRSAAKRKPAKRA